MLRLAYFAVVVVVLAAACNQEPTPPPTGYIPGTGGTGGTDPTQVGNGGQSGSGGSAGSPVGGGSWTFDPSKVYVSGDVTYGDFTNSYYNPAIGYWESPDVAATGFSRFLRRGGMLTPDGDLLYVQTMASGPDTLRRFVCDFCPWNSSTDPDSYVDEPVDNDPIISTCSLLNRIIVGITGEVLKHCGAAGVGGIWYDDSDQEIEFLQGQGGLLSFGYNNKLLTPTRIWDLSDGSNVPLTGDFPVSTSFTGRVAGPNSFWMVVEDERWTIDGLSGVGTLDGEYPPLPSGLRGGDNGKLDGEGNFFQLVEDADSKNFLVRRQLGGTSEVLLEDASGVLGELTGWLITGP